jgi:hypothetical protein
MPMDAFEYKQKTINVLNGHTNELNRMEHAITAAAESKGPIPNVKEVYKELSDAAQECATTLDYYDEENPLPLELRIAMGRLLDDIKTCTSALLLPHITTMLA